MNIEQIKEKYNGIIPPNKLSFKKWIKADIRNKNDKAIALYKYGKSTDFICQRLGISIKELSILINKLYRDEPLVVKKPTSVLKAPENYSQWTSSIINSWRKTTILSKN